MEVNVAIHRREMGYMKGMLPVLAAPTDPKTIPPLWGTQHRYNAVADYEGEVDRLSRTLGLAGFQVHDEYDETNEDDDAWADGDPTITEEARKLWEAIESGNASSLSEQDVLEIAQRRWADVRKVCKSRSPSVSGLLSSARPVALEPGAPPTLVVHVDFQYHIEQLRDPARRQTVEWAVENIVETPVLIRFTLLPPSEGSSADTPISTQQPGRKPARLSQPEFESVRPGDRVIHRLFGPGLVLRIDETDQGMEAQVFFDAKSVGKKTLNLAIAQMKKL
jgi:hypothetical protein